MAASSENVRASDPPISSAVCRPGRRGRWTPGAFPESRPRPLSTSIEQSDHKTRRLNSRGHVFRLPAADCYPTIGHRSSRRSGRGHRFRRVRRRSRASPGPRPSIAESQHLVEKTPPPSNRRPSASDTRAASKGLNRRHVRVGAGGGMDAIVRCARWAPPPNTELRCRRSGRALSRELRGTRAGGCFWSCPAASWSSRTVVV